MMYFITYVTYGNSRHNLSINIHETRESAEREVKQLKACGHTYVKIRTDLYDEYLDKYGPIA